MSTRAMVLLAAGVLAVVGVGLLAAKDRPPAVQAKAEPTDQPREADREAIKKASLGFIQAFEKGDAKAVASHWTPEGEYIADDGTTFRGRDALEKAYADFFARNKGLKVEAEMDSLRFVSRDTAIEEGHMKVRKDKTELPTTSRYSVLHVRENGKWLMAVVREWPSAAASLRDLEWLIGSWEAQRDGVAVRTTYEWDANKVYILARFEIKDKERNLSGSQRIARDPSTGLLRSWTFEDGGGFGEASWGRDGQKWVQEASGVLADGGTMTATNILTRLDDDTFTWQSVNRTGDGEELSDLPPIKVKRVASKK